MKKWQGKDSDEYDINNRKNIAGMLKSGKRESEMHQSPLPVPVRRRLIPNMNIQFRRP